MNKADVTTLVEYNYWANARVLRAAGELSAEQFNAPLHLSFDSVRGSLAHVLATEIVWRMRCQEGISLPAVPSAADFPTFGALVERWGEEEAKMREYLAGLSDEQVAGQVKYKDTKGNDRENLLWQILAHMVNHGSQFRAEAGAGMAQLGHSPGDVDMIIFFRERY